MANSRQMNNWGFLLKSLQASAVNKFLQCLQKKERKISNRKQDFFS